MGDLLTLATLGAACVAAVVLVSLAWRRSAAAEPAAHENESELLAALAHDLRSPLQSLSGWLELLRHGELEPAQQSQAMDGIGRALDALVRLSHELSDSSRMHRGELDLEKAPLALHEAVHAGVSSATTLAADKQLTLDVEARQDLPIEGDRLRLAEAVTHLVTNAVALSPAGGRVHVWCGREAAAPTIRVSAEGLLTKPRTRERASASARRLALARHIVERHGGELREHRSGASHAAVVRLPDPEGRRPRG